MFKTFNQSRFFRIFSVTLITAIGMLFRIKKFAGRDLWVDELSPLQSMSGPLKSALAHARHILQFWGDTLLIYPFLRLFGNNKWGLAIPHIILTLVGFYLLYLLCRKYFKNTLAYVITFLIVAFNANLVYHAFEIRPYSVLVTLGLAVFLVMQYIVENKNLAKFNKFMVSFFIFIVILFHLYGVYMLLFLYLFNLLFSRKDEGVLDAFLRNLKEYYLAVLFALPFWFYFAAPDKTYLKNLFPSVFVYIHGDPVSLFKGVFGNLVAFKPFYLFALIIPFSFFLPNNKDRLKQAMFLLMTILAPIVLLLLICIKYQSLFIQRLFIWEMPLFAFLVGWCWDTVLIFGQNNFNSKKGHSRIDPKKG